MNPNLGIGDIVIFRRDRLDFERRIANGRQGTPYRIIDVKQPFSARYLVLAEPEGSPILTVSGEPLEVHECHLEGHTFLTEVGRAVDKAHAMQAVKFKLQELATTFRQVLLACPKDEFSDFQRKHLQDFPSQSCDVASLLLACHLREQGFQDVVRVFGCRERESHVWLEVDGWIVDITADQFPDIDDPVIVAATGDQARHSEFRVERRSSAYAPEAVKVEYKKAYAAIKRWLEGGGDLIQP